MKEKGYYFHKDFLEEGEIPENGNCRAGKWIGYYQTGNKRYEVNFDNCQAKLYD